MARRLTTIPGIGPVGATALPAAVTDPGQFSSGRQFAAWLGLTPLQNSSGGKERLGRINKMGDKYLHKFLGIGATSLVRRSRYKRETLDPRLADRFVRPIEKYALHGEAHLNAETVHKRTSNLSTNHPGFAFHTGSSAYHGLATRHDLHNLEAAKFTRLVAQKVN